MIKEEQLWVGVISKGPRGVNIEATYKNIDQFAFQDELGQVYIRALSGLSGAIRAIRAIRAIMAIMAVGAIRGYDIYIYIHR